MGGAKAGGAKYTHFLSVPVRSEAARSQFTAFKSSLTGRIPETAFISIDKLHFTLLMLQLDTEEAIERARSCLEASTPAVHAVLGDRIPIKLHLRGLSTMQERAPHASNVLYVPVVNDDELARLDMICNLLINQFITAGLVDRRQLFGNGIKYHSTVINTKYIRPRPDRRQVIDALPIIDEFDNAFDAFEDVSCVLLSSMVNEIGEDNYYGEWSAPLSNVSFQIFIVITSGCEYVLDFVMPAVAVPTT